MVRVVLQFFIVQPAVRSQLLGGGTALVGILVGLAALGAASLRGGSLGRRTLLPGGAGGGLVLGIEGTNGHGSLLGWLCWHPKHDRIVSNTNLSFAFLYEISAV